MHVGLYTYLRRTYLTTGKEDDFSADRICRGFEEDAMTVFVVYERAIEVGRYVSARCRLQIHSVSPEVVATFHLLSSGHRAACLDPREDESGRYFLDGRSEVVLPRSCHHDEHARAAVSLTADPVEVATPATTRRQMVPCITNYTTTITRCVPVLFSCGNSNIDTKHLRQ